jgi:hypothetical protein
MPDPEDSKRGLKDISHWFLSAVEKRERNPVCLHTLAFVDAEKECGVDTNAVFARILAQYFERTLVLDFHADRVGEYSAGSLGEAVRGPFRVEESGRIEDAAQAAMANSSCLVLLDLPWYSSCLGSVLASLEMLVLVVEPHLSSFRSAWRLLKGARPFLRTEPRLAWDPQVPVPAQAATVPFSWRDCFRAIGGESIAWIDDLRSFSDHIKTLEGCASLHFSVCSGSDFPFFAEARLAPEEIQYFLSLACRLS